jgi:hypothetical protein
MRALGDIVDFSPAFAPVDIDTANGWTGLRVSVAGCAAISFVFFGKAGGAEDLVIDWQQHTAYTGGNSADLDSTGVSTSRGLTEYYIKAETALDGDEPWVRVTQAEASELTVVGATYGAMQKIVVSTVDTSQLGTGYTHVSVTGAITTGTAQISAGLYVFHGLRYRRRPDKSTWNWLNPGAANA